MNSLGIFAKFPEAGKVKTRLGEVIGFQESADIYKSFTKDVLNRFQNIVDRQTICYSPETEDSQVWFKRISENRYLLWPQPDLDLGIRMISFIHSEFEKKVDKALKTCSLKVQDIWRNADVKINEIAKEKIPKSLDKAFQTIASHLDKDLTDIKQKTLAFEPTLEKSVDLTIGKVHHQISLLEKKILIASKKQNTILTQRFQLAKNCLYPNQHLQERVFSITPFLIKYGYTLIDRLYKVLDLNHHDHQLYKL